MVDMNNVIEKKYLFIVLMTCMSSAWSMQPMDDQDLADSTGQDGMTLTIGTANDSGVVGFDHIAIEDTDGYGTTHTSAGALAYVTEGGGAGVSFYSGVDGTDSIATPFIVNIDSDGSGGNPLLNMNIGFDPSLTRINLNAFTLALTQMDGNGQFVASSKRNILRTGASGIDILFNTGSQLGVNLQLGNQEQGAMFVLSGGRLQQIKSDDPIELISYNCVTAPSYSCTEGSSLKFDFNLVANDASVNGIQLQGIYMDIVSDGLEVGKAGVLDKFDLTLSNVTMGEAGVQGASTFDNFKNGSIGNIGMKGVAITDFKTTVRGL